MRLCRRSLLTVGIMLWITACWAGSSPESLEKKLNDFNRRARMPVGINGYGLGPIGGAAVTVDWFVTPKFALEGGAGVGNWDFDPAYTLGARYHVFGNSFLGLTPYVGAYTVFHHNGTDLQNHSLYIPIGLHKIKKNGLSWSIEAGWQRNTFQVSQWTGGFRIGYRFKTGKK